MDKNRLEKAWINLPANRGAVPKEKITFGKLEASTPKYIIESDASIVAPLMFAYILGW